MKKNSNRRSLENQQYTRIFKPSYYLQLKLDSAAKWEITLLIDQVFSQLTKYWEKLQYVISR